jgi:hypothetical protein
MTVVIGRTHFGPVDPQWYHAYEHMQKPMKPDGVTPDYLDAIVTRTQIMQARNIIVRSVVGNEPAAAGPNSPLYHEASHVFFVDDDTLMPPDALMRLLEHDVPIVSGFYTQRVPPFWPIPMRLWGKQYIHITKYCPGLQEVDAVGGGCLLVKREVFETLSDPWFDYWSERMQANTSEDVPFCEKAKAAGFPILLDFDVQCGHMATFPVGWQHWRQSGIKTVLAGEEDVTALSTQVVPWRKRKKTR